MATSDPIKVAAEIVAAFVSNNAISVGELPPLIEGLCASLKRCVGGEIASMLALFAARCGRWFLSSHVWTIRRCFEGHLLPS